MVNKKYLEINGRLFEGKKHIGYDYFGRVLYSKGNLNRIKKVVGDEIKRIKIDALKQEMSEK